MTERVSAADLDVLIASYTDLPGTAVILSALKELRALRASSPPPKGGEGWRPMKTAPKDGTEVLVYVPRRLGALYACASNQTGKQWWSRNLGDVQPTHWMPLPAAPDGKATPPDEMGAEQPKAASEHLLTENARLREAAEEVVHRHRDASYSPNQRMNAVDRLAAALSERTE